MEIEEVDKFNGYEWVQEELNQSLFEVGNLEEFNQYLDKNLNLLKEEEKSFEEVKSNSEIILNKVDYEKTELIKDLEQINIKYRGLNDEISSLNQNPPNWLNQARKNTQYNSNLNKLEIYLILLKKIDNYTESAANQIVKEELTNINNIGGYRSIVKILQDWPIVNNNSKFLPYLYDYCKKSLNYIQFEIQNSIISKLELLLKSLNYPTQPLNLKKIQETQLDTLKTLYCDLLLFQLECYLPYQEVIPNENLKTGLLPLDVLVYPIWIRFQYHFMSSQPTNNPEKPEWFIQFILDNFKNQLKFFIQLEKLSKELFEGYHRNSTKINSKKFSSADVFIDWISSLVQYQLDYLKPQHLQNPHTLAHTIKELVDFDFFVSDSILKKYTRLNWSPISVVYLQSDTIKNAWLESEYKVVTVKLQEILSDDQAWDYVYLDSNLLIPDKFEDDFDMPTHSVDRMFTVFEAITERYQHVSNPLIKLNYFERVHFPLLKDYLMGMRRVSKGFERRHIGFRTPRGPPVSKPDTKNLQILQKLIHSANFLIQQIKYLENDQIFLDLWAIKYSQSEDNELESEGLFDKFIAELEGFLKELNLTTEKFTKPNFTDTLNQLT